MLYLYLISFLQHTMMMDHDNYTYLAITLSKHSRYFDNPSSITSTHPSLSYCGRVGEFSDVHLISIPKDVWLRDGSALMSQLIGSDGVLHVDVQVLRTRSKRHIDEFWSICIIGWPTISNVNFRFVSRAVRTYRKKFQFRQSLLPVACRRRVAFCSGNCSRRVTYP